MLHHVSACTCPPEALCDGCYGRELTAKRPMARVIGECWGEHAARRPEHRGHATWPDDPKTLAIARRKVAQLARDRRLVDELAVACVAGAAAWWERRPVGYRRCPA